MDEPIVRVKREKLTNEESGAEKTADALKSSEPRKEKFYRVRTAISMGITHNHVTVGTTTICISYENSNRNTLFIRNLSAEIVWIGEAGVIAGLNGNGFPLKEDDVLVIDKSYGAIHAVTENNTAILAVMEE